MALGFGALGSAALGVDGEDTEAIRFIASVQANGLSSTPSSDASADLNIEEGDLLVAYIAGDLSSTAFTMEDENGDNQFTVLEKSNVWWAHRAAYVESATANSTATINATATDNNPNGAWGFIVLQFRPHEGRVFQFIGGPAYANLGWGQDPTSDILSSTVTNGVFIGSATSDTQALSGHLLGGVTPDDTFNHSTHNFDVSYSIFDTVQTDIEYFTDTSTSSTRSAGLLAFENTAVDIKTIGTGGDYATPDEWADYIQSFPSFNNHALGRLTDDKIYNTGFSNLDLGDITRNGYTVTLEGYGAGVYDHLTDTGAKLHGGAGSYVMECRYVEVRDIYIRVNASGLNRNAIANGRNTTVKRCVLEAINSGGSTRVAYTGSDSLWESCLIIGGFYGIDSPTIGPSLKNVTFANQNGYGFTCTSHSGAIQNTVAFNSKLGGFNLTGTPTGTYSHNASQDGTHPGTDGVTLTENPFQVGNYIPKQGGQLESAGLHINEYTDLQNDSYNYIPSIGAYESLHKGLLASNHSLPGILIPLPKEFHPGFQNPRIAPSTDVTIDWENPLTKGLGYALKPQKGLIELVSGKSGIPTTTPFNVLGAYEGMKAEYSITGESDNYHNLPKLTEISNSTGVTIFDVMYIESAEDWSTMTVWRALNNDGDERLALEVNSDGDLFCMHNDSWSPSWGVPLPLNKWIVVVGRVNPDATADIFVFDGDSTLSDSTSLTLSLGTMTGARKGASLLDSGTRSVQGGSSLSGMWGRALSDSEIYNFLHNPYQILKPTEDMYAQGIYFTSTAIELPKEYHPNFQNPRVKPNCPVEIDWGNPLTKGLVHRYGGNGYDPHSEYINATQEYGLAGQSTSFALDTQDRIKYPISYGAFREQSFTAKVTFSVSGTGLCYIFNSDLRFNITVGREGVTNGILGISWYDGTFWTIDTIAPVAGRVYTMVVSRLDGVSTELYLYDNDTIRKYSDTTNTGSIVYEPIERGADLGARAFNPFTSGTKVDLYSFEYFNCYKSNTECVQLVQSPYSILKPKEPMVYNFNIRQMPTSGTSKTIMLPDGSVHTYKDRQDQVLHNSVLSNNDVYGGTYTIGTGGDFEEIHDWLSFVKGLGTLYRDQLGILIDDKDYNYGTQDQFDCSSVNLNGHTITMDVEYSVRHRGQFGKGARVEHDPGNQAMWANADQITIKNFSATNTRPDGNYNADVWSYSGRIVFINCMAECYETTTNSTCFDILGSPYHGVAYGCIAKGGFRGFSAANKEMSLFGCIAVDATDRGYNINEHSTRAFMNCVAYNCTTGFSNALVTLTNNSSNNASDDGTEYGANSITLTEYPFQPGTYIPKVGGELDNAGIFTYTEEDLLGYPYE